MADIQMVVGVDYSELTGLVKTGEQSKRVLSSVAKDFARTGNQKQYMHSINKIVMAQKQLDVASRLSRKEIMKLGAEMQREAKFTDALAASTNRLGSSMNMAKNKMNGNNMAVQQLGYQFGDFAVQVQGGTSAFVAFSQQGAQLAGILPMVAGPLGLSMGAAVGLSAALGILIPIGSAVGRMFFEMNTNAEEAADATELFAEANDSLRASLDETRVPMSELIKQFGDYATAIKELRVAKLQDQFLDAESAMKNARSELAKFAKDLGAVASFNLMGLAGQLGVERGGSYGAQYTKGQLADLALVRDLLKEIESAESPESLVPMFEELRGIFDKLGLDIRDFEELDVTGLVNYVETAKALEASLSEARGEIAGMNTDTGNFLALWKAGEIDSLLPPPDPAVQKALDKALESQRAANKAAGENYGILSDKLQLLRLELKYGEDSTEYKRVANFQEERNLELQLQANGVEQDTIDLTIARLRNIRDVTGELETQAEIMGRMAKIAETYSTSYFGEFANAPQAQGTLDAFGGAGDFQYGGSQKFKPPKDKKKKAEKDPVAEFQKQLDLETKLLTVSEARAKVLQALGLDFVNKNPEIVAGMEVQINKTLEQMELDRKRQSLIDSVNVSIEDGFMAMADGTKSVSDAFRTMAAEIVRELYKVYVMQVAIKALKLAMGIPFADGGVISGGSEVKAYANGGVVGGPTTFPMAGGKTGLMGEAGPEAIMPLKRGANGKLGVQVEGGGGGDVININQSFNFQANGDDSVKKLIAQAAPKIAEMAKSSVVESRRRGGSTKAAFG